ncbi:alpha/beta hydrolase [Candidatus Babeliales bacterium]|nr:alpha/beta hydrolase [Candidatus Babeliales bacterium]MBP9843525.1 alpha/beta hydrolase [Candidatus Babeliales bacterium]
MAILMTTLKVIGASILALAGSGATYQYVATKLDERDFPPIGRMVDIGGYKLHMIDRGISVEGQPTIVMDAGLGGDSLDWSLVQPEIAKFARVITYDRAGYGWSDVSPLARTSENMVVELHTMLKNASVTGQYILVGHSFGGLNVRLFAQKYPDEVVGIVLVDASHEDIYEKMQLPDMKLLSQGAWYLWFLGIPRLLLYVMTFTSSLEHNPLEKFPFELQKRLMSQRLPTKFMAAFMHEAAEFKQNCKIIQERAGLLGNLPLAVITVGKPMTIVDHMGMTTQDEIDEINRVWPELQADLVTKSSRGKQMIAENSGHLVPYNQPEIIVEAVREMVEELRK